MKSEKSGADESRTSSVSREDCLKPTDCIRSADSLEGIYWKLLVSDLMVGDILLYRSIKQSPVQQVISHQSDSPYTHAAVYVGNGCVGEAVPRKGVRKHAISLDDFGRNEYVAVLRSQNGFSGNRVAKLLAYLDDVLKHGRLYDFPGLIEYWRNNKAYFDGLLEYIAEHYGEIKSSEDLAKEWYFCSAFVVSCYWVVEIIGSTAQVAYKPRMFSPGDLYADATFGWFLGYLVPEDGCVPVDDPIWRAATHWSDQIKEQIWWW